MIFLDVSVAVLVLMELAIFGQLFFIDHEKSTRRCLGVGGVAAQTCIGCATSFTTFAIQTRAIVSKRGSDWRV
ncbi:hypothetical protein [Limnohabitans sp.]|uniref:hypothetical protein n=1 Tax=Limnohabitans sp. TaxID=1907725 RepID=UPI0025BF988B|nr:hypothetical protein [Limnohabitans sp.]